MLPYIHFQSSVYVGAEFCAIPLGGQAHRAFKWRIKSRISLSLLLYDFNIFISTVSVSIELDYEKLEKLDSLTRQGASAATPGLPPARLAQHLTYLN